MSYPVANPIGAIARRVALRADAFRRQALPVRLVNVIGEQASVVAPFPTADLLKLLNQRGA